MYKSYLQFFFYSKSYLSARIRTTALDVSSDYYLRAFSTAWATENWLQISPINVDTNKCYCVPLFPRITFLVIYIIISKQMQKIAGDILYFIVIFGLKKTVIGLFRYIKIQLEREVLRTKAKQSGWYANISYIHSNVFLLFLSSLPHYQAEYLVYWQWRICPKIPGVMSEYS